MSSRASNFTFDDHKMFDVLKKGLPEKITKTLNIVTCKDDVLYAWNAAENCILSLNIKTFEMEENADFQRLLPTETPTFSVNNLLVNPLSTLVCASGLKGACIMRLPRRSGALSLFQGGRPTVLCKSQLLDERLFLTQCEIYQLAWHPGSHSDSHLIILCSDNTFRLYDLSGPNSGVGMVVPLGRRSAPAPALPLARALGETTVGFAMARPRAPAIPKRGSRPPPTTGVRWPILLLRGNGDVCMVDVQLTSDRSSNPRVIGPLSMYPPADDNYGVESCSILVLGEQIVCVATCGGTLYHCLLLPDEQDNDKTLDSNESGVLSENCSLYVLEAIELDLGLSLSDSDPSYSCPIYLIPDEGVKDRYFCLHETGVHIITVPIVNQLEEFFNGSDDDIESLLPSLNEPSTAEYAVCTKSSGQSSCANPPLGLAMCYSPHHAFLAVLASGDMVWRHMNTPAVMTATQILLAEPQSFLKERSVTQSELTASLKEMQKVSFDTHIRQILKHDLSQPILKLATQKEPPPQECFELVTHATHVLQSEYMSRLERARKELERRVSTLRFLKQHQLTEVQATQELQTEAKVLAEQLRDKCNEMVKQQMKLNMRCSRVLRAIREKHAVASIAEKEMAGDLSQAQEKLKKFNDKFDIIKTKINFKDAQTVWENNKLKKEAFLGRNHHDIIKSTLEKQTDQIKDVIQRINNLKNELISV